MSQWSSGIQAFAFARPDSFYNSPVMHQWSRNVPTSPTTRSGRTESESVDVDRSTRQKHYTVYSPGHAQKKNGLTGDDDEPPEEHQLSIAEEKRKYLLMTAEQARLKKALLFKLFGENPVKRLSLIIIKESSDDGVLSHLLVSFLLYAATGDFDFARDGHNVEKEMGYIQAHLLALGDHMDLTNDTASLGHLVLEGYTNELVESLSFQQLGNFLHILELSAISEIKAMVPRLLQEYDVLASDFSESLVYAFSMHSDAGQSQAQTLIQNGVSRFLTLLSTGLQQQTSHTFNLAAHLINVLPFDLRWHFARYLRQRLGPEPDKPGLEGSGQK